MFHRPYVSQCVSFENAYRCHQIWSCKVKSSHDTKCPSSRMLSEEAETFWFLLINTDAFVDGDCSFYLTIGIVYLTLLDYRELVLFFTIGTLFYEDVNGKDINGVGCCCCSVTHLYRIRPIQSSISSTFSILAYKSVAIWSYVRQLFLH